MPSPFGARHPWLFHTASPYVVSILKVSTPEDNLTGRFPKSLPSGRCVLEIVTSHGRSRKPTLVPCFWYFRDCASHVSVDKAVGRVQPVAAQIIVVDG